MPHSVVSPAATNSAEKLAEAILANYDNPSKSNTIDVPAQVESLLQSVAEDLKDRDITTLREDLLQISEVGGLLGCALAVRSKNPPHQAVEFAASRHPQVEVLLKADLIKRLPAILAGRRPR